MTKKFFQKVELTTIGELYTVTFFFIKDRYPNSNNIYMDEVIANLFTLSSLLCEETCNCWVISDDLCDIAHRWALELSKDEFEKIGRELGIDVNVEVRKLYFKLFRNTKADYCMSQDYRVFGDDISWYNEDTLFKLFKKLDNK